jgi:hypothetical protein
LVPNQEEPWMILAALASPRASLEYLKHVLDLNPKNKSARKGMHWAIHRYRTESPKTRPAISSRPWSLPRSSPGRRTTLYPLVVLLIAVFVAATVWFGTPGFSFASTQPSNVLALAQELVGKATYTPTATPTLTPSPTPTNTPTSTPTPLPTDTATPLPTATSEPLSISPKEDENEVPKVQLPSEVERGEVWIDVDLTNQQVRVYKGKNLLNTFAVSTGTWRTPTVTGQYRVYVKYPAADMAGPGYYLPRVPYVMYFYKGYGIHGTYWHNNFGTPMSHGCVNLKTEDAEWVYNMSSVGTVVNIHY